MANYRNHDRIREIVQRRLRGEPVAIISADMGISRTYIYSLLSKLPKGEKTEKNAAGSKNISMAEELQIVMDYLECYPSRKKVMEFGKSRIERIIIQSVAETHGLSEEKVTEVLCQTTALHPMVSYYPLYRCIEKWKRDNLISMRELAGIAGMTVQEMSNILNGLSHMPLKAARRIQRRSGLRISEIYMDLLEIEKEYQCFEKQE